MWTSLYIFCEYVVHRQCYIIWLMHLALITWQYGSVDMDSRTVTTALGNVSVSTLHLHLLILFSCYALLTILVLYVFNVKVFFFWTNPFLSWKRIFMSNKWFDICWVFSLIPSEQGCCLGMVMECPVWPQVQCIIFKKHTKAKIWNT